MAELQLGLQEAIDWIIELYLEKIDDFLTGYRHLPYFPTESAQVNLELLKYMDTLGNWIRANDQWSFEVCLYFTGFSFSKLPVVNL